MPKRKPPPVIAVHGLRSHGEWHKILGKLLSARGIPFVSHPLGRLPIYAPLLPVGHRARIDAFYDAFQALCKSREYRIDLSDPQKRPSVVAHSYGTYIVANALLKYADLRLDKLILVGSALPIRFDWSPILMRDQVSCVLHEIGQRDQIIKIAALLERLGLVSISIGGSGAEGFIQKDPAIIVRRHEYFDHRDYLRERHIETHWLPLLTRASPNLKIRHGGDIADQATAIRYFRDTGPLDNQVFGDDTSYEEVPDSTALQWMEINPDIYTFLIDTSTDRARGYVNLMPIERRVFEQIKRGGINDAMISPKTVQPFTKNCDLVAYIMSLAMHPDARRLDEGLHSVGLHRLMNGVCNKLLDLANNDDVRIVEIVSVGWKPDGVRLCELLGMRKISTDSDGHPVYWARFDNASLKDNRLCGSVQHLLAAYDRVMQRRKQAADSASV